MRHPSLGTQSGLSMAENRRPMRQACRSSPAETIHFSDLIAGQAAGNRTGLEAVHPWQIQGPIADAGVIDQKCQLA